MRGKYVAIGVCAFFALGFFSTGEPGGILFGLLLTAVVVLLLFRGKRIPNNLPGGIQLIGTPPPAGTPNTTISVSGGAQRGAQKRVSTGQSGLHRLSALDTFGRVEITNILEIDESVEFVLTNQSQSLVGTDLQLYVLPRGKRASRDLRSVKYDEIQDVRIDTSRRGNDLLVRTRLAEYRFALQGEDQVDSGLRVLQDIRTRVRDAVETRNETPTAPADSSLSATSSWPQTSAATNTSSVMSLGDMLAMTPTEFEALTARALEAMGYKDMTVQGGSGDLAADVVGRDPQGRSVIVQCKRYAPGNKVGSPALQQFIGMKAIHHKADRGIYVTTADYSQQAIDLAKEHDIVLIDGDDLVKITNLILRDRPSQAKAPMNFCTSCGTAIDGGAAFCANCGTALGNSGAQ